MPTVTYGADTREYEEETETETRGYGKVVQT